MKRLTQFRSTIDCLLALMLSVGLAACGAQGAGDAFSDIALPTFSKDRVAQEAPVEVRRMLTDDGEMDLALYRMAPSRDGRYITDIRWNPADLAVRDLATGESRRITNGSAERPHPDGAVFSPDGNRIAYSWEHPDEANAGGSQLRSIGVDGTDMRVHLDNYENGDYYEPEDWSKDGRYLLIAIEAAEEEQLATVDVETNEVRILKTGNRPFATSSFFSPDGRFVTFDQPKEEGSRESDIFLVSSDGTRETVLIETSDNEELLGWLPDGSGIMFHRDASDSHAIWKLPVRDGQRSGPPELVKNDVFDLIGLGFSDDAYFYGVRVSRRGLHMASFELETGRVLEALKRIGDHPGLGTDFATWSPDGTSFAYLSAERGTNEQRRYSRIIVRSLTGEIIQELPLSLTGARHLGWSAHGLVVMNMAQTDQRDRGGYYLISLETGKATYLRGPLISRLGVPFTVSEDGSSFFLVDPDGPITEHEIATGIERVLVEQDGHAPVAFPDAPDAQIKVGTVSPDGNKIAYRVDRDGYGAPHRVGGRAIEIFTWSTGETQVIEGFARTTIPNWSPDSRYVVIGADLEGTGDPHLVRISVEDGSAISLAEAPVAWRPAWVSPDGRHILTLTGETRKEIWRMTFKKGN